MAKMFVLICRETGEVIVTGDRDYVMKEKKQCDKYGEKVRIEIVNVVPVKIVKGA